MRKRICIPLMALALLLGGCGKSASAVTEPPETVDPYAGMVQVESGFGTLMWVEEYGEVPVNPLTAADFSDGEYIGDACTVRRGVDVSEHQGTIDWAAAAQSGVEFAVIRAGYRGYGTAGSLNIDPYFQNNVNGARENGIDVGVYFFSQATGAEEAAEEAEFLLELLSPYTPEAFSLPVYYDWEPITHDTARTDGMGGDVITECAVTFCEKIAAAGYAPGVYAYRNLGYFTYDLRELRPYRLWIAAVGDYPDFYYAHDLWQYSYTGHVPGIETYVDLDFWFIENTAPVPEDTDASA